MKRVAIITNIPAPYRVDLFYYLQQNTRGYDIYVFYASKNEDNRKWNVENYKMKNCCFLDSYTLKIPFRYDIKYIHITRGIKKALEKLQPEIVVGSEYNPTALQALQYCRRKNIPYICWTDGTLHSERNINLIQKYLRKYMMHNASAYLASSTKAKEAQLAYGAKEERCFVSFLTVDIDKYLLDKGERENGRILCVGSLIERKGIDLLLKALKEVNEDYILVLVGTGREEEKLKHLARELQIVDRVRFLGHLSQEKLKKEYERSSIFVLPTREDCFALVILEAMCAGLPIVGSKYAGGTYDLIEEGKNGYVVDPYDTKQLRECLLELLRNPKQAENMGKKSLENVQKFRFEQVSKGFWEAFLYVERSLEN